MTESTGEFLHGLIPIPEGNLVDEPETSELHINGEKLDLLDISLRLQKLEGLLDFGRKQTGSGYLTVESLPLEDASAATPRLIWSIPGPLTCQTSKGRNLEFKNIKLHLWQDARTQLLAEFSNSSRHSNWEATVTIEVWYKSGHPTRPEVSFQLWFGELRNGHVRQIDSKFYSDKLASLYSRYTTGELYLRFFLFAERTN